MKLTQYPGYVRFWVASTISDFGTYITTIAVSVIVVLRLDGGTTAVGIVSAARWLPYPLFGLLVGAWIDRHRHKPILIASDLGRCAILVTISVLGLAEWLNIPLLVAFIFAFGMLSLVGDAAFQAFTPMLVPSELLVLANARIEQSDSVAQTAGPAFAGWIIGLLSGPAALLLDAASYVGSALCLASIPSAPAPQSELGVASLRAQVSEGLAWVYRHPRLGPLAWTTHLWFLFFSMFGTVFTVYALRDRELGAGGLGVVLACSGAGALIGTMLTERVGEWLGAGWTMICSRALYPVAFTLLAAAGFRAAGSWQSFAVICCGQALIGLALGIEGAQEMGYQQAVTPARLMGRMSATRRSLNRGVVVVGAPLGGVVATMIGSRPAILVAAAGMVAVVLLMAASDLRNARMEDRLALRDRAFAYPE